MFAPAVVVHGLVQVRAALRPRSALCLLSAPGAGRYAGAPWWRAMIEAGLREAELREAELREADLRETDLRETDLRETVCDLLDCGDAPGAAMAALRHGQRALILDPRVPAYAAVAAAAAGLGGRVLPSRPAALDLAKPGAERKLAAWLRRPGGR